MRKWVVLAVLGIVLLANVACAFTPPGLEKAKFVVEKLAKNMPEKVKEMVLEILNTIEVKFTKEHEGDLSTYEVIPGVYENVLVTIGGYGSKLGQANQTEWVNVSNQTVWWFNLSYYPRNITLYLIGYSWWNSSNQHIVNGSGDVISDAPISEEDGSFSVSDDYTSEKPIWDSIGANITVNTSAEWLEHDINTDTIAEAVSIIYNITIDDGEFTSMTWKNVSVYVAPNSTAGTGHDDLNIYYSTDGGSTWETLFDADDGSTSSGTQWTGDISLPIAGNKSVLINITFVSDGADDEAGEADVHINDIQIVGSVSKLPTRNPRIYIDYNGDGIYEYEYGNTTGSAGLANGTAVTFDLGDYDLNLTNKLKVYVEGSQKVTVRFTWNDENRTAIRIVKLDDKEYNVATLFLAQNETYTFNFTDVKTHGRIPLYIDIDEHSTMRKFNYTVSANVFKWEGIYGGTFIVDPQNGIQVTSESETGKPVPVFIRPESKACVCNITLFRPNATDLNSTILNMIVNSEHGNMVHFVVADIDPQITEVALYIDGKLIDVIPVHDQTVYFNYSNWSEHTITLKVYDTAFIIGPAPVTWHDITAVILSILFVLLIIALVMMCYGVYRGRWR